MQFALDIFIFTKLANSARLAELSSSLTAHEISGGQYGLQTSVLTAFQNVLGEVRLLALVIAKQSCKYQLLSVQKRHNIHGKSLILGHPSSIKCPEIVSKGPKFSKVSIGELDSGIDIKGKGSLCRNA
ncbi:hypothetical protein HK096_009148 [Nowakowskiella sp. JEL0078]|nr:hypothetical protein HK096_009148 [Nowakowskiella sp. JEL0078]